MAKKLRYLTVLRKEGKNHAGNGKLPRDRQG